jgi:hypothetical protein
MHTLEDPFAAVILGEGTDFSLLTQRPASLPKVEAAALSCGASTGRFDGFDLDDHPLVSGLAELPGEVVKARTTVALAQRMIGAEVVVLYEKGDPHRPIVMGVLQDRMPFAEANEKSRQPVSIQADGDRFILSAEREIVLSCGDASITLTRAGKVIIKGNYILSRSTGYNKIKGAAIDIN